MVQPVSSPQDMPAAGSRARSLAGIGAGLLGLAVVAGAVVLWSRYGTAVFFEMIVSGLQSCF